MGLRESRIQDFEYCYKNGMSMFLKRNEMFTYDGYAIITFNDCIDNKCIVRSYHGPVKQLIMDESDNCSGIIAQYPSIETMVDDGWAVD